jgi:hypothetical protein
MLLFPSNYKRANADAEGLRARPKVSHRKTPWFIRKQLKLRGHSALAEPAGEITFSLGGKATVNPAPLNPQRSNPTCTLGLQCCISWSIIYIDSVEYSSRRECRACLANSYQGMSNATRTKSIEAGNGQKEQHRDAEIKYSDSAIIAPSPVYLPSFSYNHTRISHYYNLAPTISAHFSVEKLFGLSIGAPTARSIIN